MRRSFLFYHYYRNLRKASKAVLKKCTKTAQSRYKSLLSPAIKLVLLGIQPHIDQVQIRYKNRTNIV